MPRVNPGPPCSVCGSPSIAKQLCETHYRRLSRNNSLDTSRPADWGKRESHPLYTSWKYMNRYAGRTEVWQDFWKFVKDVGDRPSARHVIRRFNKTEPFGPDNYYWAKNRDYSRVEGFSTNKEAAYARAWRKDNPLKAKHYDLKRRFGLGMEEYLTILESQGGGCGICGGTANPGFKFLAVDHDHISGKVRGLLCNGCNQALGLLKDKVDLMKRAIQYLEKSYEEDQKEETQEG